MASRVSVVVLGLVTESIAFFLSVVSVSDEEDSGLYFKTTTVRIMLMLSSTISRKLYC